MNKSIFVGIAILIVASGCATSRVDFRANDLKESDRVLVGRVMVTHRGDPFTKDCRVEIENGSTYQLDETGLLYLPTEGGTPKLKRILCQSTSWYHYEFTPAIPLRVGKDRSTAVYFGDVAVDWDFNGGLKLADLLGSLGRILFDSGNDGHLTFTVADNFKQTVGAFHSEYGRAANMHYAKSLLPANRSPASVAPAVPANQ
ncbi:MAG: hypothetical protein JST04_07830 [Bdellovibrionales bacterium]|nr:hypothetical protein [Bdellovibrionales bacterium]